MNYLILPFVARRAPLLTPTTRGASCGYEHDLIPLFRRLAGFYSFTSYIYILLTVVRVIAFTQPFTCTIVLGAYAQIRTWRGQQVQAGLREEKLSMSHRLNSLHAQITISSCVDDHT